MHNFKEKLKDPVRAGLAFISFLLCIVLFLYILLIPYNQMYSNKNQYQIVFIGASLTSWGVNPATVQAVTGDKTCLLSSDGCPLYGRYALIKSAIEQESVETVVLDISYDILSQDMNYWQVAYQFPVIAKLNKLSDKLDYFRAHVNLAEDFDLAFTEFFRFGYEAWEYILQNGYEAYVTSFEFDPHGADDMRLDASEIESSYNSECIDTAFLEQNLNYIRDMIQLCQDNDVRIVLVTPPFTETHVWKMDGLDIFRDAMLEITESMGCEYYDFNLYKARSEVFDDGSSFCNENHLSDIGAEQYSVELGSLIKITEDGTDVSDWFYDTYAEAKTHSCYASGEAADEAAQ